jgi:hypothetical protein
MKKREGLDHARTSLAMYMALVRLKNTDREAQLRLRDAYRALGDALRLFGTPPEACRAYRLAGEALKPAEFRNVSTFCAGL